MAVDDGYRRRAARTLLQVTEIEGGLGLLLPRDVLAELGLQFGDEVSLTRLPDGYALTRSSASFDRQIRLARDIMEKRRDVLSELAK